jgi:3-hydroxyisobutyrate dehydrogenase-like beta-hydroxyacid dehydrogenase
VIPALSRVAGVPTRLYVAPVMTTSAQKTVGVIGLGIIGSRIAKHLRKAGFDVHVWNRTKKDEPQFAASAADLAKTCSVIEIFVSNDAAILETIDQLKPALTKDHLLIIHSTISPETAKKAREEVSKTGAHLIDAPFTGSKDAAQNGQLMYYLAGDPEDLERAKPFLAASSKGLLLFDRFGDASTVKIATNMVTGAIVQSLSEALAICERSGISGEKFERAVRLNACRSGASDLKLPLILKRDFEPHFSIANMLKDSNLGLEIASRFGLELPATIGTNKALTEASAKGWSNRDYAIVSELVRKAE